MVPLHYEVFCFQTNYTLRRTYYNYVQLELLCKNSHKRSCKLRKPVIKLYTHTLRVSIKEASLIIKGRITIFSRKYDNFAFLFITGEVVILRLISGNNTQVTEVFGLGLRHFFFIQTAL